MKKLFSVLLICVLIGMLAISALAASDPPEITMQPQSPNYPEYSTAIYTVKAEGTNLRAFWYLEWNGETYSISNLGGAMQPWEGYAGETYGAQQLDHNTFMFFFGGIGSELNGASIWCVVEDGHFDVVSQKARIMVGGSGMPPAIIEIPAGLTVEQGEEAEIRCVAQSPDGSQLSFLWYETDTGALEDIRAVNRGTETSDYLICDTSTIGTRNYLCMVQTSQGGVVYSSVVPVKVTEKTQAPTEPTVAPTTVPATEPTNVPTTVPATEPTNVPTTVPATESTAAPTTGATEPPATTPGTTAPAETAGKPTAAPTNPPQTQPVPIEKPEQDDIPWWSMVLIGAVAAGAGVGVAVLLVKKKS